MKTLNELNDLIIAWANERNLLKEENAHKQLLKSFEEIGELSRSLLKNHDAGIKDGIGDVVVTLIILAAQKYTSINECLEIAYNEIKSRTGTTLDGIFIKENSICCGTGNDCCKTEY